MGHGLAEMGATGAEVEVRGEDQYKWDAAVKRPFSLAKMLAAIETKNEAGVAKRLRMAGALNSDRRLLYFYGLGIALSSNNNNHDEYKFEATLLSQYLEDFSSYTLKRFLDDYTHETRKSVSGGGDMWQSFATTFTVQSQAGALSEEDKLRVQALQDGFSLIKVKILLESLLNGFRDLTLIGVQAFDFNHLNNVLVSHDCKKVRIIDIDGASKGSIQFPSQYIEGAHGELHGELHKPALDVDLATLLPLVVQQLMFGKGRGKAFVNEQVSLCRRAKTDEEAKAIICTVLRENFFPELRSVGQTGLAALAFSAASHKSNKLLNKVVEWFFASLMRRSPWMGWTNDIYDAMRCIDHLPIS
jgi:hypothetical protein